MSDNPQDYIPPKHREAAKQETEMLRAVNDAVSEVQQAQQPDANKVQDFATLGASAVLKYGEASAKTCEQTGDEIMQDAQRLRDECYQLAEDIRHVARIQAQAVQRAMDRNRETAQGVTALRKAFHEDISRERTEIEAKKARANS